MKWLFAGLIVAIAGYLYWRQKKPIVGIWENSPPIGATVANTGLDTVSPPAFSLSSRMPVIRNILFKTVQYGNLDIPVQPGWNPVIEKRTF